MNTDVYQMTDICETLFWQVSEGRYFTSLIKEIVISYRCQACNLCIHHSTNISASYSLPWYIIHLDVDT